MSTKLTTKNGLLALTGISCLLILVLNTWTNPIKFELKSKLAPHRGAESVTEFMKKSEKIWERSVARRHKIVGDRSRLDKINPWRNSQLVLWWDFFYPSFNCPHHLERLGRVGDGGKWVCGFSLFENPTKNNSTCVIYSFGVNDESSFEKEIIQRSSCHIWAYDNSVEVMSNSLENHERVHFKKYALGVETNKKGEGPPVLTLGDIMEENGHEWIDMLKIDIEGWEFSVFKQIMTQFKIFPFGQLQLELHADNSGSFREFYEWWEELEGRGLRAIWMEPNNYMYSVIKRPSLMEYVFLNVHINHTVIM